MAFTFAMRQNWKLIIQLNVVVQVKKRRKTCEWWRHVTPTSTIRPFAVASKIEDWKLEVTFFLSRVTFRRQFFLSFHLELKKKKKARKSNECLTLHPLWQVCHAKWKHEKLVCYCIVFSVYVSFCLTLCSFFVFIYLIDDSSRNVIYLCNAIRHIARQKQNASHASHDQCVHFWAQITFVSFHCFIVVERKYFLISWCFCFE